MHLNLNQAALQMAYTSMWPAFLGHITESRYPWPYADDGI